MSLAVEVTGISQRFGEVQALDAVDLRVERGTIHAVVGENGAGKTTLMRALYGALHPDTGSIKLDGNPVALRSSAHAIELGVGMVSQHYGIIPELDCLQNLILGAEGGALLKTAGAESRATSLAERMGFQFNWRRSAAGLSPAGAQKLEILKLLWRNSRIMILDEPTAMLSPADGEALFQSLRKLVDEGNTVILVTHRLPEVFDHCSHVTVLRGGRRVADMPVSTTNPGELTELIVGKRLEAPAKHEHHPGQPILELAQVRVKGFRGNVAVKDVGLTVRSGEMVGIAGVDGSGQRELFHAILGIAPIESGSATLSGASLASMSNWERLSSGISVIPEDRHSEAVIEEWSLEENAALGRQRNSPFARGRAVDERGRQLAADEIAKRFRTKHGGLQDAIEGLSGGNQQRFVAGRALFGNPKLLLAFQPARGLDLAATQEVYEGIRSNCLSGGVAIVVSYDLDELLEHCDRIVVMNRGEMFQPPAGEERDPTVIGRLMVGAD